MGIELNDQQYHALYDIENWWSSQNNQVYELSGAAGTGKAQPVNTIIPTPEGDKLLDDLKVGDYVFNKLGKPVKVLGVYDQGELDVYQVLFSDGRITYCNDNHLWTVCDTHGCYRTETLRDIIDKNMIRDGLYIPLCEPVSYPKKRYSQKIKYQYGSKIIPKNYFFGDVRQRIRLMRELFINHTAFLTKDNDVVLILSRFVENTGMFIKLFRNLGLSAYGRVTSNGFEIHCEICDRLVEYLKGIEPIYTEVHDHINKYPVKNGDKLKMVLITDMKYKTPMKCLYVDDPEHLYLTNDYIVTHNTTLIKYFIERIGLDLSEVAFVAYMGKAAMQMARNGLPARTIHSFIYSYQQELDLDKDGKIQVDARGKPKTKPVFVKKDVIDPNVKLIVVDEASMVNKEIAKDLLSFDKPVIALGDLNQLPPVFGKSYFLQKPNYVLTEVMRQQQGNPIVWLAHRVLNDFPLKEGIYGKSAVIPKSSLSEFTLNAADIVLTCTNRLRYEINNIFREDIKKITKLDIPHVGEKIICRRNNWERNIADSLYLTNGLSGIITYVDMSSFDGKSVKIDFKPDFLNKKFKNVPLDYKRLFASPTTVLDDKYAFKRDQFEFAYAITVHACLPLDTLIYTSDGIMPLRKLSNYQGKVFNGRYWETPSRYIDNGYDELNKFTLSNGMEYSVTDFHRCKVFSSGKIITKYGKDVKIGDALLLRKNAQLCFSRSLYGFNNEGIYNSVSSEKVRQLPNHIDTRLSEVIGILCSHHGRILKHTKGIQYICSNYHSAQVFLSHIQFIFGYDLKSKITREKSIWLVTIEDKFVSKFFYNIKGLRGNKHVPKCILHSDIFNQKAFLRGLFENSEMSMSMRDADRKIALNDISKKMCNQISVMLLNIGITPHIVSKNAINSICITSDYFDKYVNEIGFISSYKDDVVKKFATFKPNIPTGLLLQYDIVYVEKIDIYSDYTACLEMPESHEFIQNGVLGGNSQGSQYPNVVFLNERMTFDHETYKRLQYTAITRASENITIVI